MMSMMIFTMVQTGSGWQVGGSLNMAFSSCCDVRKLLALVLSCWFGKVANACSLAVLWVAPYQRRMMSHRLGTGSHGSCSGNGLSGVMMLFMGLSSSVVSME